MSIHAASSFAPLLEFPMKLFIRGLVKAACAGLTLLTVLTGPAVLAQDQVDITIHAHFGRASQMVIPQSRGFVLEQRGQAIQIESVEARVKILEQTASTTMEIHLRNPGGQQTEAVVLLPVPNGAVVSGFAFEGAASEPTAKVLSREEARRLYDAIVAKVRDPALLEFAGYNLIRSSVFPIAAGGTQKVRLTYEHLLPADGNRIDYVLPRSESFDSRCPWRISVDIQHKQPISTVYSPSHDIQTVRQSGNQIDVKLVDSAGLDPGPFLLSYLLEKPGAPAGVTASLFAYPDPRISGSRRPHDGGYFLLMAGLPASLTDQRQQAKREVTLVIDRSGSMAAGGKMDQAKAAAVQVIEGLADGEAFNIIDYSTTVALFAPRPVIKNDKTRVEARRYIEAIGPGGGTNIHDALLEALRAEPTKEIPGVLPIVLFLTDGLPTVGVTSEIAIRDLAEQGNTHHRRVFAFGVGNDVNVPLLDRVADITRATATYVLPEEDVEVKVAAVFKRLYGPVFKDIKLTANGNEENEGAPSTRLVRELIPSNIPDLFEGDQMILLGQYLQKGPIEFTLAGDYMGEARMFSFKFDFDAATTQNAFVPRLWAARRIAYLVDQIRQAGAESAGRPLPAGASIFNDPRFKELTDEILRLSTEFGILTEYTAFLATEGTDLSDWERLRVACGTVLESRAVRTRSGKEAVNQGINFNAQKSVGCTSGQNRYVDQNLQSVEVTNVQQRCGSAFFKRGNQWIDGQIINPAADSSGGAPGNAPGHTQTLQHDEVIQYGSPAHLELLHKLIGQNRQGVLSLDGDIMIQFEGRNILVRNDTQPR
jgi:Ca-activated chloride channel family protein